METPRQAARAIASLGREKKNNNNVNDINNLIQNYNYYNEQNNNDDYNEYNKINNLMDVDEKVDENKQDNFSLLQYQAQPFSDMHTILAVGSSSILDRSCLLCSLLLGFGLDAYVAYIVRFDI
ncbi:MAG: hypothetical protein EZS28_002052 [Streblomastix strix]|uniref:CEP76/DRC7 peptidase-like domain-containing protein n=1 Tax=Streblomastix strix TaxID=222440 RepID=A0A5J4X796_9EUKA|nr:MAG: hypothetical protein EZS28_002052 [Streblomastix strix]